MLNRRPTIENRTLFDNPQLNVPQEIPYMQLPIDRKSVDIMIATIVRNFLLNNYVQHN